MLRAAVFQSLAAPSLTHGANKLSRRGRQIQGLGHRHHSRDDVGLILQPAFYWPAISAMMPSRLQWEGRMVRIAPIILAFIGQGSVSSLPALAAGACGRHGSPRNSKCRCDNCVFLLQLMSRIERPDGHARVSGCSSCTFPSKSRPGVAVPWPEVGHFQCGSDGVFAPPRSGAVVVFSCFWGD